MYKIIRQERKTVTLSIDDALNIIVKVPYYYTNKQIEELLKKHELWIETTHYNKKIANQANDWLTNKKIMYLGEYREICIQHIESGNTRVEYKNDTFFFYTVAGTEEHVLKQMLENCIRKQAKQLLTVLTQRYCEVLKCDYASITIRKQKTRWGSCSSKGNLSYNVRLMCAPIRCIEYVVLHEVMHRRHFDHGNKFWADLEQVMPDYLERKNYITQYGRYFQI